METHLLKQKFEQLFSCKNEITHFSPGSVNLIGEHIDYTGGKVFPFIINKGIYILTAPCMNEVINIYSETYNEKYSVDINAIDLMINHGWRKYVRASIDAA